jgi:RNA polymerase sigma factor (sigma-70 family)
LNGARSVLRSRKRRQLLRLHYDPPVWSAEAEVMVREDQREVLALVREDQREVLAAIAKLPPRQREVLALRYYAGLSHAEIAAALSVTTGTVSSTMSHALTALARELEEG